MITIPDIILLNKTDNVVVCVRTLQAGDTIVINGRAVILDKSIGIGHKLAAKDIRQNDLIIKYGVPIGTATVDIAFGSHVHTNNMKSNYIATYLIKN